MKQTYWSPSVDTAARVLEMFTRYRTRSCTLSEISGALDVSKATCLRILKTLQEHGLLHQDEATKRYSLGYFAAVVGARAEESLDYLAYVRPLLAECARRTGLTAAFVQRVSDNRMMYVAKAQGEAQAHVTVSVGNRFPITEVSYGKWVLAFADQDERKRLLAGGLRAVTANTVTDVQSYVEQVEALRDEPVLVSRAEYVRGVTAVSTPVRDARGDLLGVVVVLGLSEALEEDEVSAVLRDIATRCRFDANTAAGQRP